jgi:glutathione S-transferase
MIELVQLPWSPFCIVQRRILEYARASFKIVNIPNSDRSLIWKLTGGKYYAVPIIRDGKKVLFETDDNSQEIARYLDAKFHLDLFPPEHEGVQNILARFIENEIEGATFRLNDIHYREFVPKSEWLPMIRHKERKFGRGCLDLWREQKKQWLSSLDENLAPFEAMLKRRDFLLDARPRFVDFDLYGMLGNFLFSNRYRLPSTRPQLGRWYRSMTDLKVDTSGR